MEGSRWSVWWQRSVCWPEPHPSLLLCCTRIRDSWVWDVTRTCRKSLFCPAFTEARPHGGGLPGSGKYSPIWCKVLRYLMSWAQLIIRLGNKITTNYNMERKKTLHWPPSAQPLHLSLGKRRARPVWEQGENPQTAISGGLSIWPPAAGLASTSARLQLGIHPALPIIGAGTQRNLCSANYQAEHWYSIIKLIQYGP